MNNRGLFAKLIAVSLTLCMMLCTPIVSYAEETELTGDGINWVRIVDDAKYMYVGIDNSKKVFESGSQFIVNKITRLNEPKKYDEYYDNIDTDIQAEIDKDTLTFLEVSVRDSDGAEYGALPDAVSMYVQLSDSIDKDKLVFNSISVGLDESVNAIFERVETPFGPCDCARLKMKHVGCTLMYAERNTICSYPCESMQSMTKKAQVKLSKVTALKSGKIKLTFKRLTLKNGYKIREYQVFRKTGKKGEYKKIATIINDKSAANITYTNGKSLKKGKRYYYKVRGVVVLPDERLVYTMNSKSKNAKCKKSVNVRNNPAGLIDIVPIPSIVGLSIADAAAILADKGLLAEIVLVVDKDVPEGIVVNVDPSVHSRVANGSTVKVFCSRGAEALVKVPNVIGKSYEDAKTELTSKGFKINTVDGKVIGTVILTDPLPGVDVPAGSDITMTLREL